MDKCRKVDVMRRLLFTLGTLAGSLIPAFSQQNDDASRGVVRVSVVAGDVSVRRGDSGDNVAATINAPLVAQDRLLTGPGARAELQFDYANMVRLGANTELRLAELQYQRFQLNLPLGLVTFKVWQNSQSEVDINTPVASIRPLRKGEYRVQVLEDGTTEITVRDGELDIFTPQGSRKLGQGRTLRIQNTNGGEASFQTLSEAPFDSWDQWNRSRDQELASSRSSRYLPQGVYGGEQLDANGDWVYSAPYGNVWQPRVAANWAPYRTGRWSWLDYYGWSWVSYDPWGWAPYHYGRWFNNSGRWCWWPGAIDSHQFWSPALVSFVGFGGGGLGGGLGFGWGNVGWVPLAPFETYNRWYGRGFYGNRNNNTTIVNNVNITNIYRNARVDGGVSYVEAQNFNRGIAHEGGNSNGYRAARSSDLSSASEFRGPVGIAPNRESVRYASQEGVRGSNAVSASREDQRFTARREASQVERVPFEQQRQNVENMARGSGMIRNSDDGVRGGNSGSSSDGFRRVGEREVRSADGFVQRDSGVRGGGNTTSERVAGARGSEAFVQRDNTGSRTGNDGFRRLGGDQNTNVDSGVRGTGGRNTDGFVQRERGSRGADSRSQSGWDRFGNADANSGARGSSSRNSEGFVQRESGVRGGDLNGSDGGSRSRGAGALDVSPRIVDRGSDSGGQRQGNYDPFGGGVRGRDLNSGSNSGWGSFGGVRGGSSDGGSPRMQQSTPRSMPDSGRGGFGGFGGSRGGDSSPQMSAPSGGGGGARGGGADPSGGGGGARGGSAAPAGGSGGGGGRGGRGGNQ